MNKPVRPKHAGLRHVALNVHDLAKVEYFYVELMGMQVEWRPDDENVYLCSGNDNLALHKANMFYKPETGADKAQSLDHIGFIVDDIDEVDRWFEFLTAHDVKFAKPPKTHRDGARSFYCFDPENNTVQIIYHPPISKN